MPEALRPQGRTVAQVMLDSALPQLDHQFDYSIPADLADEIRVGQRVRVPFRSQSRKSYGYVIGFADRSSFSGELQPIAEIVSQVSALTPEIWRLARALADRAGGSASDILRLAIPKRMVRAEKAHIAAAGEGVSQVEETDQDEETAAASVEPYDQEVAELLVSGARLAVTASHGPERLQTGEWVGGWAARLARTAMAVYSAGRSVILVAPDYRDVDQLHDALTALGHTDVVRVDARQSGSARYAGFMKALDHTPRIILGNRSAIYSPAYRLGAVLLWDDGDPLLSEPLAPYVHARDAALLRAQQSQQPQPIELLEGAGATEGTEQSAPEPLGLMFASHSRSSEVQRLVEIGYVQQEALPPKRTRVIAADAVQGAATFSTRVPEVAARVIREGLKEGPVLVQVATPGYAPVALCETCDTRATCRACKGPLGFRSARQLSCRWCGQGAAAWRCDNCGGANLVQRGAGSQRTVEQFAKQFAGTRVILSDGEHPHERVDSRPALVVATRGAEPIAAGGYRAVVLLDAEKLLGIESLRAAEDCLRWWSNAAALAGPDARCVLASGVGPVVNAFVQGRIEDWLRGELRDRQQLRYPPAVRVASVTGGSNEVARAIQKLGELPGVDVLGPTPVAARSAESNSAPGMEASLVRSIVRFDYAQGAEVAKRLRGALIADAAGSHSRVGGRSPGRARPEALRLRFDDRGVFDN